MSARGRAVTQQASSQDFLASVSDLMSGLIFIFIITIAVFALRLAKTRAELTNAEDVREAVVKSIADELKNEGIDVEVDLDQGVLRLTDRAIQFPRGQPKPLADHHDNVGIVASVLLRVLRCYVHAEQPAEDARMSGHRLSYCQQNGDGRPAYRCPDGSHGAKVDTVLIEGHTDSVPIGAASRYTDNLDLSAARSAEVFRMMHQCEPQLPRLVNRTGSPVISVSGYGEMRPIDRADREADANRRIDLRFLMEPPKTDPEHQAGSEPQPVEETRRELSE
jgi:chemotaxis protein MotB